MKARKIIFIPLGLFIFLLILLTGTALYIYTHPATLTAIVERAFTKATGASFSVQHLNYSLNPISIRARGVVIEPQSEGNGFSAEIQNISADGILEGSFGDKTLLFRTLKIAGLKFHMVEGSNMDAVGSESGGGSLLASMARSFISFFFFRDIKFEAADVEKGFVSLDAGGRHLEISRLKAHLSADHVLNVNGRLIISETQEKVEFLIPDFHVESRSAFSVVDPRFDFMLSFSNGSLGMPQAEIQKVRAKTAVRYEPQGRIIRLRDLFLTLRKIRLKQFPQTGMDPSGISFKGSGDIDLEKQTADFADVSLDVAGLFQFKGKLDTGFGKVPRFKVVLNEGRVFSKNVLALLQEMSRGSLRGVTLSGPMDFSGSFEGSVKENRWTYACHMMGKTENISASYRAQDTFIKGLMTARVTARGPLSALKLSGNLNGNEISVKGKGLSLASAEGSFDVEGTYPVLDIKDLSFAVPQMGFSRNKETLSIPNVKLSADKGNINVINRSAAFSNITVAAGHLRNIHGAFHMEDEGMRLTVKGRDTGLVRTAARLKLLPDLWTYKGVDSVSLTAQMNPKGKTSFSAELGLENFGFQNPAQNLVGEAIAFSADLSGHMTPGLINMDFRAEISADAGEVLMDRFYFDLGENGVSVKTGGRYRMVENRLRLDELSVDMKKVASVRVTGALFEDKGAYGGDFSLKIPDTPLDAPFQKLIREPFQTENPILSNVSLEGTVGAELALKGTRNDWVAKGIFTWKDGRFSDDDAGLAAEGIQISIPVWLARGKAQGDTEAQNGNLSVRSMQLPFLPEQALNISLKSTPNRLLAPHVLPLKVPGGTVQIGPSKVEGLMDLSPDIYTAMAFENLELAPILSEIWPQPLNGTASGDLNPIRIKGGRLESAGKIKANIFDGTVTFSHINARGLFSGIPVYGLDARWHHLKLARMTEGTSFGKITGLLDGYAKEVEISNGQFQRFDLLFDTVKSDDVPQKISVKAVDNIARLGGGQSPFAGITGIFVSLFKEFPYQKIGVHATLENDIFRINGTIHENGKEYLVKRGFFSGVDVINQNKENRVGFKDMLKRIKRITDSKGGPIIR